MKPGHKKPNVKAHARLGEIRVLEAGVPVVIGSGVAGLTAALGLDECLVLTRTGREEGASRLAQGGVAAAIGEEDSPRLHAEDTMTVSGGLGERPVADLVTAAAPERIEWLLELGAQFDRGPDGILALGREAGHRRHRIVHAEGDATGAELVRILQRAASRRRGIRIREYATALDLIRCSSRAAGVLALTGEGELLAVLAPAVVIATGGLGFLYARTTDPPEVMGDGLALAGRAGVTIADPEFVQFHPTALRSRLDPMPLITEALRGAGAALVDREGNRFMAAEHPDGELAPRDIVARAIWRRLATGGEVFLDATGIESAFPGRFPTVFAAAAAAGFDPRRDLLPVSPVAHFHMGGVLVDADGRASLSGLYACGEAAATGLHGANRLASNSLLEGLVFGARVALAIKQDCPRPPSGPLEFPAEALEAADRKPQAAIRALRETMWEKVGVVRDGPGLRAALARFDELEEELAGDVRGRTLLFVARCVTASALRRCESRGGHFRSDYPEPRPEWATHTLLQPEPVPAIRLKRRDLKRGE